MGDNSTVIIKLSPDQFTKDCWNKLASDASLQPRGPRTKETKILVHFLKATKRHMQYAGFDHLADELGYPEEYDFDYKAQGLTSSLRI
jgi:hypothetical protein